MKSHEKKNDEKLQSKGHESTNTSKMSKKRRQKIEKIMKDNTLTKNEKDAVIAQLTDDGVSKRPKRSQVSDYKSTDSYIAAVRPLQ